MPAQEIRQRRLISALSFLRRITPDQARFAKAFCSPSAARFDNAIECIERRYGSIQNYLRQELQIGDAERKRLQELYLEDTRI